MTQSTLATTAIFFILLVAVGSLVASVLLFASGLPWAALSALLVFLAIVVWVFGRPTAALERILKFFGRLQP